MKNVRVADKFRNCVTGEEVAVTAVANGKIDFNNNSSFTEEQVKTCFRFLGNDTPLELDAAIIDGALMVDGHVIETGVMKNDRVIASVPGGILFTTKVNGDKLNVIRYDLETENFSVVVGDVTSVSVLYQVDKWLIYKTTFEEEVVLPAEKEGEDPKVVKDYTEKVFFIREGKFVGAISDLLIDSPAKIVSKDNKMDLIFFSSKKLEYVEDENENTVQLLVDNEKVKVVIVSITELIDEETGEYDGTYVNYTADEFSSVKAINEVNDGRNDYIVVTEKGIHLWGRHHMALGEEVVAAVATHPILVRFTEYSHDHDHDTFVLANDKYEVVTIRVKRVGGPVGYVTTVE